MTVSHTKTPPLITPKFLARWPLPQPGEDSDKDGRGQVLIVGGSRAMPGAVLLAATAALRAGAGKLQIATVESVAVPLAVAIPEAYVLALPETTYGAIDPQCAPQIIALAETAHALLIGPGMTDEARVTELVHAILPKLADTTVVLDAAALVAPSADAHCLHVLKGRAILTPHATEMSLMRHLDKDEVANDPLGVALAAAADLQAVVALKGAETFIAAPDGTACRNRTGNVGLATSGSGDTLAGLAVGLAARGADPMQAAAWAVYLHGSAGNRLAGRMGSLGFLARELLAEVPALMQSLSHLAETKKARRS